MKTNTNDILKVAGVAVTIAGGVISVASSFIDAKTRQIKIEEEVAKAIEKMDK